jgi:hypothetical protein
MRGLSRGGESLLEELPRSNSGAGAAGVDRQRLGRRELLMLAGVVALAGGIMLARQVVSAAAATSGPVTWKAPAAVDVAAPFANPDSFTAISCTSAPLCLGTTGHGELIASTNPTGGSASDWSVLPSSLLSGDATAFSLDAASCAAGTTFCDAAGINPVNGNGVILGSSKPTGGKSTWKTFTNPDPGNLITVLECVSSSLCIAGDSAGNLLAWDGSSWTLSSSPIGSANFTGLSCTPEPLCLAVDGNGNAYTSTTPQQLTAASWSQSSTGLGGGNDNVTCASSTYCVAQNNNQEATTTDAGSATTWNPQSPTGLSNNGPSSGLTCEADSGLANPEAFCLAGAFGTRSIYDSVNGGGSFSPRSLSPATAGDPSAISCATKALCAAGTNAGDVTTSTDPGSGSSSVWSSGVRAAPSGFNTVQFGPTSCPSAKLCVGTDGAGRIITSTNPAGGQGAWTTTRIDGTKPLGPAVCPSKSLCVTADGNGDIVWSTNPAGGKGAWHVSSQVDSNRIGNLSCPSTTLCVAADGAGDIVSSTNPAGGKGAWHVSSQVDSNGIGQLSCPSTSLCVAANPAGDVLSSTHPAGGKSAWHVSRHVDSHPIFGLSCPSTKLCVASDGNGDILSSTNPAGGAGAWTAAGTVDGNGINNLSCPSAAVCVATDSSGRVLSSTHPATGAATWAASARVDSHPITSVSCPSATLCILGDQHGNVIESTNPAGGASAWSSVSVDPGQPIESAACRNGALCVLGDNRGYVVAGTMPPKASAQKGTVKGITVKIKLSCAGATGTRCKLTLTLKVVETLQGKKVVAVAAATNPKNKKKTVIVGSKTVTLAAGKSETVQLSLNHTGKSLLSRLHRLPAQLTVVQAEAANKTKLIRSQTLTFKKK